MAVREVERPTVDTMVHLVLLMVHLSRLQSTPEANLSLPQSVEEEECLSCSCSDDDRAQ